MSSSDASSAVPLREASKGTCPARPYGRSVGEEFFARPADKVAAELVGKILWRDGVGGGWLTEVEAYLPSDDPACHAFRGPTARNRSMFGPPGHMYVYLSYGIHVLLNLVCDHEGVGAAVLVRSFEPLGDSSGLWENRITASRAGHRESAVESGGELPLRPGCLLSCGPGRVGQALGLSLDHDGLPLGDETGLRVIDDGRIPCVQVDSRIGLSKGSELPLRFLAADSRYVSRRSKRTGV